MKFVFQCSMRATYIHLVHIGTRHKAPLGQIQSCVTQASESRKSMRDVVETSSGLAERMVSSSARHAAITRAGATPSKAAARASRQASKPHKPGKSRISVSSVENVGEGVGGVPLRGGDPSYNIILRLSTNPTV